MIGGNNKLELIGLQHLTNITEVETQIIVYKLKCSGDLVLVADVMKSFSLYRVEEERFHIVLIARYPNGQWCFDMHPLGVRN